VRHVQGAPVVTQGRVVFPGVTLTSLREAASIFTGRLARASLRLVVRPLPLRFALPMAAAFTYLPDRAHTEIVKRIPGGSLGNRPLVPEAGLSQPLTFAFLITY